MQGIIWNHEQKLLDNFRQTAKGEYELIYLFEKSTNEKAGMVFSLPFLLGVFAYKIFSFADDQFSAVYLQLLDFLCR